MFWRNVKENSLEKLLKIFAYLEFVFSLFSTSIGIFALVFVSRAISESKKAKMDTKPMFNYVGIMAIKLVYLVILFFLVEACLTIFLLYAVRKKNLRYLKLWLVFGGIYTVLYITDFISTLHAMSIFEDVSMTLGTFLKVPLLYLAWKFAQKLENDNGENLINQI